MAWYYGTIEITAENGTKEANEILSELKKLTDKYGFPSERNMGYSYEKKLNRIVRSNTTIVLMIHIYKYGVRIYEDKIPDFICDGVLHPRDLQKLKQSMGFGYYSSYYNEGFEYEMKVRQEMYNKKKKQ